MNWEQIRQEYESTDITLKALAEKHDIKLGTLKSRKSREKWIREAPQKDATRTKKGASFSYETSWIEIENEYVTDIRKKPCTLKDLSQKYEVAMQTIMDYSAAHNWSEKRRQFKESTKRKTIEKTVDLISDELALVSARHLIISTKLLTAIEKALEDEQELYKYVDKLKQGYGPGQFSESIEMEVKDALNENKLVSFVNAADKLQKMQRQVLGILDAKEQHKIEMDKRKLGDGEDEYEDDGFLDALEGKTRDVWRLDGDGSVN
ncbi:hypothetical protein [Priestia koreensis]|uniref:hypothetical protein n=1 Tax=Priestia koreensis TaxID=284581 RepID=UPI0030180B0E